MSWTKVAIYGIFFSFTSALIYSAAALLLFLFSGVMLYNGKVLDFPILHPYQRFIYFSGMGKDWDCFEYDEDLIYKPKLGACQFNNPEFKTTISFDSEGRVSPHESDKTGIAVIGDSHAMGWGVNDNETFSALLEERTGRPVYNFAVASYATFRELLRLEKSGLADRVDTVIIQYCDNDLVENKITMYPRSTREEFERKAPEQKTVSETLGTLSKFAGAAIWIPLERVSAKVSSLMQTTGTTNASPVSTADEPRPIQRDFSEHYAAMKPILEKFATLLHGKKVIVFYSNPHGQRFDNFSDPARASNDQNIDFVDLELNARDYFEMDDHLTKQGHVKVAGKLAALLNATSSAGVPTPP